jgi:DNA helicase IV
MHDIVGTIQREQDAIIRSALKGILVVQGGPGTGKTAVALHRAAYLLYTYRQRLQRDGVLIVGPNPVFLRYIEQVLPSLGEHSVVLATLGELYAGGARPCHIEEQAVAELKGDRRMAGVIEKALSTRERPLKSALTLAYGVHQLTVRPAETRRIVESARKRRGTHNARRLVVERMLAQAFVRAWRSAEERLASGKRKEASRSESARLTNQMASHLRRDLAARAALERMWPLLSPEELLHDLFGSRALLRAATRGALGEQEAALLYRKRSASLREIPWSEADMALLDEAAQLLGPAHRQGNGRPQVRRGERDEEAWMLERVADEAMPDCPACGAQLAASRGASGWRCQQCGRRFGQDELSGESQLFNELRQRVERLSNNSHGPAQTKAARLYGHVVVDEAQGVSPMQWRSLARRCPPGSFTVVGDLSQATSSYAATTWEEALRSLPGRAERRLEELTVNYRTPSEVMTLAARVLAEAAPSLTPPRSVRASGQQPLLRRVANGELEKEVVKAALAERRALGEGKIVVIAPDARLASLAGELEAPVARGHEGLSPREAREILDAPLVVLGVDAVRGLEFDSVVLVDPAEIVSEHSQGLRAVYVALTRTTKRLQVIHSRELPRSLRQPPS